jgi:hypothetical protein
MPWRTATSTPRPATAPPPTILSGSSRILAACGPSWTASPWSIPPGRCCCLRPGTCRSTTSQPGTCVPSCWSRATPGPTAVQGRCLLLVGQGRQAGCPRRRLELPGPPGRAHRHQGLSSRVLDPDGCLVRRGRRGFRPPPRPVSPGERAQQLLARGPRGAGARPARAAARRWPPCGLGGAAGRTASAVQAASDAQRQLHALVVAASDSLRGRLRELEPTR